MFCYRRRSNLSEYQSDTHAQIQGVESSPFAILSILVGNSGPFLESKEVISSRDSVIRKRELNFDTLWTSGSYQDGIGLGLGQGQTQSGDHCAAPPTKIQRKLETYRSNWEAIFKEDLTSCSKSLQDGEGFSKKDQFRMLERWIIMNESQDERKERWTTDDNAKGTNSQSNQKQNTTTTTNNVNVVHDPQDDSPEAPQAPESGSEDGEEGSFPNEIEPSSDNQQVPGENADCPAEEEEERTDSSSHFLFIGPVGKIRRHCRERRTSGDIEVEVLSPASIPATPENPSSTPPPPLVEDTTSEDSSRSRASGSTSSRESGRVEESGSTSCSGLITSTPTSVIRSVPRNSRGDEQPLNLSLPGDHPHSHSYPSQAQAQPKQLRLGGEGRGRVSVINIAPREKLQQVEEVPLEGRPPSGSEDECPSHFLHQGELPELGFGQGGDGQGQLSPGASTSADFYAISTGSVLSPEDAGGLSPNEPSSFQGLLFAQGIQGVSTSQNNGGEGSGSGLKKKLKCRDCGKEFSQLRNYKYHRSRHEGTQQFACTCPVCGKTFNDKGYLSSHLKIHRNEKEYKCEWCGKSFNQRVAYNMHIRIHTGHKPHHCNYCEKSFSRKMLLRQHIRTHTGERPYKCVICSKAFADRSNMLLHQRLHSGERPYKCHICGKSFSKNHHLKTHLNHHAGIKPYQCEKCKACFSQSSNMKTHYRKCSRITPASSTITSNSLDPQLHTHSSTSTSTSMSSTEPIPGPSTSSSRSSSAMGMSLCQNVATPYPISMEEAQEAALVSEHQYQIQTQRRRQFQPEQFVGLSPLQQHQFLSEMSASLGTSHRLPSPLISPTNSTSSNRSTGYRSGGGNSNSALGISCLPQNMTPYSMEEAQDATPLEDQLHQHQIQIQQQRLRQLQPEQFIGLSPLQQQQLLTEMSASLGLSHRIPSPLHSPGSTSSNRSTGYRSSAATSFLQSSSASPSQALGFSLGSMSLNSPTGLSLPGNRSRRPSGLSLLSPTSLAAGHPFIPLNALESILSGHNSGSSTPHLSPSGSLSSPAGGLLIMSPRHQHGIHNSPNIGNLSPSSEFSPIHSITQSITAQQQRNIIANRSRSGMNSQQHQQTTPMETGETEGSNVRSGYHPGH